ncbi:MAG: hypothetical protein WBM00_12285 [Solirubrobacterales bacterium]
MHQYTEAARHALDYPFRIPLHSFVCVDGHAADPGAVRVDLSERIPVLAYGSNAAPAVLGRKLAATPDPVPVLRAVVSDLDVVYSAHLSSYGSVPATLQRSPGTEAMVCVAYVTGEQLRILSRTEPNYDLQLLGGLSCIFGDGSVLAEASAYVSRQGCLLAGASEVAMACVPARGRAFEAMNQRQVLEHVRRALCPQRTLSEFVTEAVGNPEQARRWTGRLQETARPFGWRSRVSKTAAWQVSLFRG